MHTPQLRPERLILIGGDPAVCELLADVCLVNLGARVLVAQSGDRIKELVGYVVPDLIMLGAGLSATSVIDCVRWLSGNGPTSRIPVIGMSAPGDREAMLSAGCVDFIAEPFDVNEVIDLLSARLA